MLWLNRVFLSIAVSVRVIFYISYLLAWFLSLASIFCAVDVIKNKLTFISDVLNTVLIATFFYIEKIFSCSG